MEDKNEFWNRYARAYAKFTPKFQKELLDFVAQYMYGTVGDLGVGVGKLILPTLELGDINQYLGIDLIPEMLNLANQKVSGLESKIPIELIEHDLMSNKDVFPKEYFDTIGSVNVLYALPNPMSFLLSASRMLKKKGRLIIASQRRKINLGAINAAMDEEFGEDSDYQQFKADQIYLTQGIIPRQFENCEIESLLSLLGFEVEVSKQCHYFDSVFSIVARKL